MDGGGAHGRGLALRILATHHRIDHRSDGDGCGILVLIRYWCEAAGQFGELAGVVAVIFGPLALYGCGAALALQLAFEMGILQ